MKTQTLATSLLFLLALTCIILITIIANTLDITHQQLNFRGTGPQNTLGQTDRNLDQFIDSLVAHKSALVDKKPTDETAEVYRSRFDVLWGSLSIFKIHTPGTNQPMPEISQISKLTNAYLQNNEPYIYSDEPLSIEHTDEIYTQTRTISEHLHELEHNYYIQTSDTNRELKSKISKLLQAFWFFSFMFVCTGGIYTYSLVTANRRAARLLETSEKTQTELTIAIDELRSGKLESKAKDSFLAAASHDLRQPLHALGLFLGALEKHVRPQGRATMKMAQKSSTALTKLLSSLLDISRLDAGVVKVSKKNFPLRESITTLKQEFQATAADANMRLDFAKTQETVFTDRILLDRVLRNIIENALIHSKGSVLNLRSKRNGDQLVLQISDDGKGIPQTQHDDIFSEYYQIGNPERDRSKGLGIGLSIVKRLSQLLELDLNFNSTLNNGSTFTLHLPLAKTNTARTNADKAAMQIVPIGKSIMVAIIEDEEEIRQGMEIMLNDNGYMCISAESAEELLAALDSESLIPDILVTDYRLRENKTGVQAVHTIGAKLDQTLPAIIITGDTSPNRVKEATESGFTLLHKPVEPKELLTAIHNAWKISSGVSNERRAI